MKRILFALTAMLFTISLAPSARAVGDTKVQESLMVSTEWLAAHLNDDSFEDWSHRPELPVEKSEGSQTSVKP